MNTDRERVNDLVTRRALVGANTLAAGFQEKVHEYTLAYEPRNAGLRIRQQRSVDVQYNGVTVGANVADLLVGNAPVIELKPVQAFTENHRAQCLNYLRATGLGSARGSTSATRSAKSDVLPTVDLTKIP